MTNRLNQLLSSSRGRSMVTWLLTNILYSLSSGMDPIPYIAILELPFCSRKGLISIFSQTYCDQSD
uniref:Uncharacterized protein n=1 Tax=Anguilla anguilla TaxID=7936 RepID=A0A0E9VN08_ANGAN